MKLKDRINNDLIYQIGERGDIIIPNYYLGMWEADVLRIRRSGMVYEYEVKTSRADYFNDFKKEFGGRWTPLRNKHKELADGTRECNRFFFVVPENLIKKDEVPPYAGLVYYKEYKDYKGEMHGHFNPISQGKLIRKKFPIDYETIARKLSFREHILRMKHRYHHQTLDDLRSENRWLRAENKKLKKEPQPLITHYEYGVVAPIGEDYWATLTDEEKIEKYFTCMYGDNFPFSMVDDGVVTEFCNYNKIDKDITINQIKKISNGNE